VGSEEMVAGAAAGWGGAGAGGHPDLRLGFVFSLH
jgi:hypothetical protein